MFTNEYFSKFDDGVLQVFYTVDCLCRGAVQRFKTKLIEALGKMNGWTMERTQQEIDFEAFSNVEIREILKDESTAKEKLIENMKYNYKFEREFKNRKRHTRRVKLVFDKGNKLHDNLSREIPGKVLLY